MKPVTTHLFLFVDLYSLALFYVYWPLGFKCTYESVLSDPNFNITGMPIERK